MFSSLQLQPPLVHVIELRELAGFHRAFRGCELADDDFQQRGFAEAVPPAYADALAVLKREIETGKQFLPGDFHAEIADFHRAIAELRRRRNDQLHVLLDHRAVLRRLVVITLETVLLLAALRARPLSHPRQLLFQKHLALVLDGGVGGLALGLVQQVIGVIAGVRKKLPVAKFQNARGDAIQKIAVVRDDEKRAAEIFQKLRDPLDGFRVEMIRRLVEHQEIRARNDRAAHRHAPLLAAGQRFDAPVAAGTVQMRHRHLDAPVHRPAFERRDAMLQVLVPLRPLAPFSPSRAAAIQIRR